MAKLSLTIACGAYDRTAALIDGTVSIEGCEANFLPQQPEEIFYRAFRGAEFDVAELSLSTYLIKTARGECPYIGIPVFLSRSFRHSAFYVRGDRGIESASDLRGRRLGVPEYQVTAAVWARGILADDFHVAPETIEWVTGGVEQAGRQEKAPFELPRNMSISAAPNGRTLSAMLEKGELDGIVAPRAPSCFTSGKPHIARLFPDYRAAEQDYFRRTGIFPIMHLVGVRRSLVEQAPWLPASLCKAFEAARKAAMPRLEDSTALHVSLPWLVAEVEATKNIMGDDYWPYGIASNKATIETLLRYHHEQGLSNRRLAIDEVFAAGATDSFKV